MTTDIVIWRQSVEAAFAQYEKLIKEAETTSAVAEALGYLECLKALGYARLAGALATGRETPSTKPEPDRLLMPEQAAEIAGVPTRRIYDWARGKRWATRPSRRTLRIYEGAFRRWLESRN